MARRMSRGRGGRRRRSAFSKRRSGGMKRRSAKGFRRSGGMKRRANNHLFVRAVSATIANIDSPAGAGAAVVLQPTTAILAQPATITGEVSPYGTSSSWMIPLTFSLDRTIQAIELINLYDQYKILSCQIELQYSADSGSADWGGTTLPRVAFLRDYDDSSTLTREELLQSPTRINLRRLGSQIVKFTAYPKVRSNVGLSTVTNSTIAAGIFTQPWLDVTQSSIVHFGGKLIVYDWPVYNETAGSLLMAKPALRVTMKYVLAMKNVR